MSFEENLLDGFDALSKRTALSLDATKGMGSLFKKLSVVLNEFGNKSDAIFAKYRSKKMLLLDGTIRMAVEPLLKEMEAVVRSQTQFAEQLMALSRDADAFVKERDKTRKKLLADADALTKDWDNQVGSLRKAKENYHKCSKDASSLKAKERDSKDAKSAAAKSAAAQDKANGAEEKYQEVLRETNAKQKRYYSHDQPQLLRQFQEFEEARVVFGRGTLDKFLSQARALALPAKWETMLSVAATSVSSINVATDMEAFVATNRTGVRVPDPLPFESADGVVVPQSAGGSASSLAASQGQPSPVLSRSSGSSSAVAAAAARCSSGNDAAVGASAPAAAAPVRAEGQAEVPLESCPKFKALYDYVGANDTELNMKEGDVVVVTETDESGWWYATNGDKSGFVPANYLTPL
eukprot:m51a1_g8582 hypothetical protein (408) ;mRNA; r:30900-32765